MNNLPCEPASVLSAGLLLTAIPLLKQLELPHPTATAVLKATGATRTTAYKVKADLDCALPDLLKPPGRPSSLPTEPLSGERCRELHRAVLRFVYDHPGCVSGSESHRRYSSRFHCFVLDLCATYQDVELTDLAEAIAVPLGTLKDWLRGERPRFDASDVSPARPDPGIAQFETVLSAWASWDGGFIDFCEHVQFQLRIPFSRKHLSQILEAHGVRLPKKRGRRSREASALRGAFETFFPGAQWVGDGTELAIEICGRRFLCNLELNVDTDSGAFVGASLRPTEDSAAVVEALADGVATTGKPPLALLLDNKPSNHTEVIDEALGETLRIRARPFTPTDKPHCEGAFGLFAQEVPPLRITAGSLEEIAGQIVELVVATWARAVNHRPRVDRNGKARAELYFEHEPTDEEIASAKNALQERLRKQERARQTRAARQDPLVRASLDNAFARLGLDDPDRHLRTAIASWPLDAVLAGIAIFEGKQRVGTLPDGVDGRYLLGIVRNVAQEDEGWAIAEALLRARLRARDQALCHLEMQRDALHRREPATEQLLVATVEHGLTATRRIDRLFWLIASADIISDQPAAHHRHLLRLAGRRIHASHRVPHRDRLAATRFLFAKVVPIA